MNLYDNIVIDIVNPRGVKVATLYDSEVQFPGQLSDFKVEYDENEITKLTFTMPVDITDENGNDIDNPRWEFIRNEYIVRYTHDGESELFAIKSPAETDNGLTIDDTVSCLSLAEQVKHRGLTASWESFTDNAEAQMEKILIGTGWSVGTVDTFIEEDIYEKEMTIDESFVDSPNDMNSGAYGELSDAVGATSWDAVRGFVDASYTIRTHGKNLCSGMFEQGELDNVNGDPVYNTSHKAYRSLDYFYVKPFVGSTFTVSGENVGGARWHFYTALKTQITTTTGLSANISAGCVYVKLELLANSAGTLDFSTAPKHVQIEFGNTATAYKAYETPYEFSFSLGAYDEITRGGIIRKTEKNPETHEYSEAEVGKFESLPIYNAKLYDGGIVVMEAEDVDEPSVDLTYTVDSPEGASEREKWRATSKELGTSAYDALVSLKDTFGGKLRFNTNNKTVDFVKSLGRNIGLSFKPRYNAKTVKRVNTSDDLVTRLFVVNQKTEDGYLGIEKINPLGTDYIMNFNYYRGLGVLTEEQETAIASFEGAITSLSQQYRHESDVMNAKDNDIAKLIGITAAASAPVSSIDDELIQIGESIFVNDGQDPRKGDILYVRTSDGTWKKYTVVDFAKGSRVVTLDDAVTSASVAWWFTGSPAGIIGGRLIILDTKIQTLESYKTRLEQATDDADIEALNQLITETEAAILEISNGSSGVTGLNEYFAQLYQTIADYELAKGAIAEIEGSKAEEVATFETAMGNLIHDGIFPEGEYAPGQEKELYSDAVTYLQENCEPQVEYTITAIERAGFDDEYAAERVHFGDTVYVDDPRLSIKNLKAEIIKYTDQPLKDASNAFNIGNFAKKPIELFEKIVDTAEAFEKSKAKYDAIASILDENGNINAAVLAKSIADAAVSASIDLMGNPTLAEAVRSQLTTKNLNDAPVNWSGIDLMNGGVVSTVTSSRTYTESVGALKDSINDTATQIRNDSDERYAKATELRDVNVLLSTTIEQTDSSITLTTTQLRELQNTVNAADASTKAEFERIQAYMQFADEYLTIGKLDSPFSFRVGTERLSFLMDGKEIAYMSNSKLYITQAEMLTSLKIGDFAFEPQANGNLSLVYVA